MTETPQGLLKCIIFCVICGDMETWQKYYIAYFQIRMWNKNLVCKRNVCTLWYSTTELNHKNVNIKLSAHDTFLEKPSSGKLKIERLESRII